MSGSNEGGDPKWRPTGVISDGGKKCAIVEKTILNSPVHAVVSTLVANIELDVALEQTPRKRLVALNAGGAVAGSITSSRLVDLIECIEAGHEYIARVISVSSGRVEIEIRPK